MSQLNYTQKSVNYTNQISNLITQRIDSNPFNVHAHICRCPCTQPSAFASAYESTLGRCDHGQESFGLPGYDQNGVGVMNAFGTQHYVIDFVEAHSSGNVAI